MSESTTAFLNRWLDRTPLAQLGRTKTFIVVPAFNIAANPWRGYSDLIGIYDYQAPNNITLRNLAGLPSSTNYTMIISYVNSDRSVKRFRLVNGAGAIIFADIPQYVGQVIKKNFRIEIWSTPATVVSQATDVTLHISVLNAQDYRYGSDQSLVATSGLSTNFANVSTGLPDLTSASIRLVAAGIVLDGGGNVTAWNDSIGNINLAPTNAPTRRTFGYVDGIQCLVPATMDGVGTNASVFHFYLQIFGNVGTLSNDKIIQLKNAGGTPLTVSKNHDTTKNNYVVTTPAGSVPFYSNSGSIIIEVINAQGVVNVYEWTTGLLIVSFNISVGSYVINEVVLGDGAGTAGSASIVNQLLAYSAVQFGAARNTTLEYLVGTPFIWPYNPVLNTDSLNL